MYALIQILNWLIMTMDFSVDVVQITSEIATDLLVVAITWIRTYKLSKLAASANIKTSLSSLLLRDGKNLYAAYSI